MSRIEIFTKFCNYEKQFKKYYFDLRKNKLPYCWGFFFYQNANEIRKRSSSLEPRRCIGNKMVHLDDAVLRRA